MDIDIGRITSRDFSNPNSRHGSPNKLMQRARTASVPHLRPTTVEGYLIFLPHLILISPAIPEKPMRRTPTIIPLDKQMRR